SSRSRRSSATVSSPSRSRARRHRATPGRKTRMAPAGVIRALVTGAGTGSSGNVIRALRAMTPVPFRVGVNHDRFTRAQLAADPGPAHLRGQIPRRPAEGLRAFSATAAAVVPGTTRLALTGRDTGGQRRTGARVDHAVARPARRATLGLRDRRIPSGTARRRL